MKSQGKILLCLSILAVVFFAGCNANNNNNNNNNNNSSGFVGNWLGLYTGLGPDGTNWTEQVNMSFFANGSIHWNINHHPLNGTYSFNDTLINIAGQAMEMRGVFKYAFSNHGDTLTLTSPTNYISVFTKLT